MQRVIVELVGGPLVGTKKVLAPGGKLRVGRRERADLVVPDDRMSAPHFEIAWDGSTCTLRDLKSQLGTLVAGQSVKRAELGNGTWIRAGGSDFMVFLEESTPPPMDFEAALLDADEDDVAPDVADWLRLNRAKQKALAKARADRAHAALARLRAVDGPLYAVLDAARSDRIVTLLQESVEEYRSLYQGAEGDSLAHVAPYLVSLPSPKMGGDPPNPPARPVSRLLARLVEEGWERRWASFFSSPRPFEDVRRHLRRFLMIADADTRERFYFRFYDPGVLRAFLPTVTLRQREEFFGPIESFWAEGEHGELHHFEAPVNDGGSPGKPGSAPKPPKEVA